MAVLSVVHRSTVIPALREGVEASGRSFDDYDVVAAVPSALTDDPDAARAALRQELVTYCSLPFYRAMLEASGFAEEIAAFDAGMAAGDVEKAKAGISDRMLSELAGIGGKDEVHAAVAATRTPGSPRRESAAFRAPTSTQRSKLSPS